MLQVEPAQLVSLKRFVRAGGSEVVRDLRETAAEREAAAEELLQRGGGAGGRLERCCRNRPRPSWRGIEEPRRAVVLAGAIRGGSSSRWTSSSTTT